jgi:hypothetical protein
MPCSQGKEGTEETNQSQVTKRERILHREERKHRKEATAEKNTFILTAFTKNEWMADVI